ncbi:hypothetical protein [Burkholderia gladioli]|uniref:hypothetical protein n=1 Tax=Burkholderia gladioli TaxID=28095 RepID=UPI00164345FB|nr:hypothetical protein [Burkholderia gladioli]
MHVHLGHGGIAGDLRRAGLHRARNLDRPLLLVHLCVGRAGPGGKASASLPKLPCTLSCPQARLPTRAAIAAPKKPRPAIALRRETDSGFALTEST